jgi:hypothetical protein
MEKVYSFVQSLNKFGSKFEKLYDYMDVQNFSWSLVLYKKLYEICKVSCNQFRKYAFE